MRNLNVIAVNDRAKVILKLNSSLLIVLRTFRGDLLCIINHLIEQYYIPPENYLPKDILKGKLKDIPKDELENSLKDKLKEKFGDNINFKVRDWERWFLLLKSENPNNTLIFLKTII